jgi:hypothetical protein
VDETALSDWRDIYLAAADQPALEQRIAVYQRLLPFQAVCYLLDGLRNLPQDLPDAAETLSFLADTLSASLNGATEQLGVQAPAAEDLVHSLFARLPHTDTSL